MRKIVSSAEYRMDKQFKNFLILEFRWFSKFKKFWKFLKFPIYKISKIF